MPSYIIKLTEENKSWYLEYSTIVDAPITYGMSLDEFKKFYQEEYGCSSMDELEKRLLRVEERGTSAHLYASVDRCIQCNRAGKNETCLTKEQLIAHYCKFPEFMTIEEFQEYEKNKPMGKKWIED